MNFEFKQTSYLALNSLLNIAVNKANSCICAKKHSSDYK